MTFRLIPTLAAMLSGLLILLGSQANALPVTYTFEATASGELGATGFSDAALNFTLTADTDDVQEQIINFMGTDFTIFTNVAVGAFVDIAGLGSFTIADTLTVFSNITADVIGLTRLDFDVIDIDSPGLTYDLRTSFGPISQADPFFFEFDVLGTAGGELSLTDLVNASFQAVVQNTGGTSVPEPATAMLLVAGLAGLGWARRRPTG